MEDVTLARSVRRDLHLLLLIVYSVGVVALGLWTSRLVRGSSDFFVGGRALGPGAAACRRCWRPTSARPRPSASPGKAYQEGISAWWWVGSAGIGSMLFAFTVAPALWRLAKAHQFYTTGDYLEFRYGVGIRTVLSIVICLAALILLAGQLLAGATILKLVMGIPLWAGALIGAAIMTIYFAAGGLLGSAWVNSLQLVVMLGGFLFALPVVLENAGGFAAIADAPGAPPFFDTFLHSSGPRLGLDVPGADRAVLPDFTWPDSEGLQREIRGGVEARHRAQRRRPDAVRVHSRHLRHGRAHDRASDREPERRPAGVPDDGAAGLARRAGAVGGVLDRGRYLRHHSLHAVDGDLE